MCRAGEYVRICPALSQGFSLQLNPTAMLARNRLSHALRALRRLRASRALASPMRVERVFRSVMVVTRI